MVKYLLYLLLPHFLVFQISAEDNLCPLFKEESYFLYYRTFMIYSSVSRLEELVCLMDIFNKDIANSIRQEIEIIKYNLGEGY